MDKQYTIRVSRRATAMLYEHVDFLAQVSPTAADRLIEEFEEKVNSLRDMPERNPVAELPVSSERQYHKVLLRKRYQIIYQILEKNIVDIAYVIDCRQDNSWLIF